MSIKRQFYLFNVDLLLLFIQWHLRVFCFNRLQRITSHESQTSFHFFYISQSDLYCLPIVGAENCCCLWSHSVTLSPPQGRTPLDECSVSRRDLYLTTCNTHNRQTSILTRRYSNPQSQQASGRGPTPLKAQPLGSKAIHVPYPNLTLFLVSLSLFSMKIESEGSCGQFKFLHLSYSTKDMCRLLSKYSDISSDSDYKIGLLLTCKDLDRDSWKQGVGCRNGFFESVSHYIFV